MYFIEAELDAQITILKRITPHIDKIFELYKWYEEKRTGGEKAKAAKAARLEAIIATKAASNEKSREDATRKQIEAQAALEEAEQEAAANGISMMQELIPKLLTEYYDMALEVLSALYNTTPEELKKTPQGIFGITKMIKEALKHEVLLANFPQLRPLAQKTQLDT